MNQGEGGNTEQTKANPVFKQPWKCGERGSNRGGGKAGQRKSGSGRRKKFSAKGKGGSRGYLPDKK